MTPTPDTSTYVGRHRPTGIEHLARIQRYLELETAAKRGRYHYFPRHNAEVSA